MRGCESPPSASLPLTNADDGAAWYVQVYKRVVQRAMLYGPWQVMHLPWRLDGWMVLCPLGNVSCLLGNVVPVGERLVPVGSVMMLRLSARAVLHG